MLLSLYSVCLLLVVQLRAIAITGISAGVDLVTGQRPWRQEISTFATTGAAWDLFILSLRQLQLVNQTEILSFFQISGQHNILHNIRLTRLDVD